MAGYASRVKKGQSHFEVTVWQSIPTDRAERFILALLQTMMEKPKRRKIGMTF